MKKRILFILFCCIALVFDGHAQMLQAIAASGGSGQGGGVSATWTVGEPAVATLASGNYMLTPGFLQPVAVVNPIPDLDGLPFTIGVYPNPSHGCIIIQLLSVSIQEFRYQVLDATGRLLYQVKPDNQIFSIDLGRYASGSYLLKVLQTEKEISTFKILKQ